MSLAEATCRYIEDTFMVTSGQGVGEPMKLLPWQRKFIAGLLAEPMAFLTVARGNGKSSLVSAIVWACLPRGPMHEAGEILVCASNFAQARGIFTDVTQQLERDIKHRREYRITDNANQCQLSHRASGLSFRVLGSKPQSLHGSKARLIIGDEPAQWPSTGAGDRMWSAIKTSTGKVPNSKVILIGTRADHGQHFFERCLQDKQPGTYRQVHAASRSAEVGDKAGWLQANPSAKHWPMLYEAIKTEAGQAAQDAGAAAAFKALRLNQGVADYHRQPVLDLATWQTFAESREPAAEPEGQPVYGVDLAGSISMAAIAAYWPQDGSLKVLAALPREPDLAARERQARKPAGLFRMLVDAGELMLCGHRVVDHMALLTAAISRFGEPYMLAGDRYRKAELEESMRNAGMFYRYEGRGLGWRDAAPLIRQFRGGVLESKVRSGKSLLMRTALADSRVEFDQAGNCRFAKDSGEHTYRRDDACIAASFAVAEGLRLKDELDALTGDSVFVSI